MTTLAVCQSNYIPWKGYFDLIRKADIFVLYDTVQYTKNDWRNRNRILTSQGVSWLTVPVRHLHLDQLINEIQIADQRWQTKHWRTLEQHYRRAPYFERYADDLSPLYHQEWHSLSALNESLLRTLCQLMQIGTRIVRAEDYHLTGDRNERLVQLAQQSQANRYLSGPSAMSYLDQALFTAADIEVSWMNYSDYRPYPQLHQPFVHAVSVLDLLFNTGPDYPDYL
jgi:hypothetical protein